MPSSQETPQSSQHNPVLNDPVPIKRPDQKPVFCIYDCELCDCLPNYTLNEVQSLGQKYVNEELVKHKHKSSLKIMNKFRKVDEGRAELLNHYRFFHNLQ